MVHNPVTSNLIKSATDLPKEKHSGLARRLSVVGGKNLKKLNERIENPRIPLLFIDEFTNTTTEIGIKAHWIEPFGLPGTGGSARSQWQNSFFPKDMCEKPPKLRKNVAIFGSLIDDQHPLVGIEPSAILTFRDEYPLLRGEQKIAAKRVAKNSLMIDEFW